VRRDAANVALGSVGKCARVTARRFTGMSAFWVTWAGLVVSFTASGLTRFGLSVWVYQETRDAQAFALLLFFGIIPLSIGSLVAGPLVDRLDRRRVLMVSSLIARLPTLVLLLLWWQGGLALWHIYLALVANGLANAFVLPAYDASVRMLVPSERLGRASGFSQLIQSLGLVVGPPIAGALLVTVGLGGIFALDLASVALALLALTLVRIPNPDRAADEPKDAAGIAGVWRDFVFGLRYVIERPAFLFLSAFMAAALFAGGFTYALSGPVVLGLADEATMGLMYAAFGIGSVAGAVAIGAWGGPPRRVPAILVATLVSGVATALLGVRPDVVWIGVFLVLLGGSQALMLALNRVVFQQHAAPAVLGRVFAFRMVLAMTAQAAGVVTAGSLAAHVFEPAMAPGGAWAPWLGAWIGTGEGRGAALLMTLAGVTLVALTLAAVSSRRVRRLEDGLVGDAGARAGATLPTRAHPANAKNIGLK